MHVWNVLHAIRLKYRTQKNRQKCAIYAPSQVHASTIQKNLVNSNISSIRPHNIRPTDGWDRFWSLGHTSKFQRVSRLAFVTAATPLTGGQPSFARCLAVTWAFFRGLLPPPLTEFCPVRNSLYVQVFRSPILAALLHGTPAASVSQTLRRCTVQRMELRTFRRGRHLYSAGRPSRWASAHIYTFFFLSTKKTPCE